MVVVQTLKIMQDILFIDAPASMLKVCLLVLLKPIDMLL